MQVHSKLQSGRAAPGGFRPRLAPWRSSRPPLQCSAVAALPTIEAPPSHAAPRPPAQPQAPRAALPPGLRGARFWAPPVAADPGAMLRAGVPFLTRDAGALPAVPADLDHALHLYGGYISKYVSVRVDDAHVKLRSWDGAVDALRAADAGGRSYWCSLLEGVSHPGWWPPRGHVPNYDQVIFGRGNASIGLHFDKDNACAGGSRRPVATYLAICRGAKLVLLLPPGQALLPPGGDSRLLLEPTPAFLARVEAAGGHYFILEDAGQGGGADAHSGGAAGPGPGGVTVGGAPVPAPAPAARWRWQQLQRAAGVEGAASGRDAPPPRTGGGGGGGAGAPAAAGEAPFSATALVMPAGWWHWVVGLTPWHVVYGGSLYEDIALAAPAAGVERGARP